MARIRTIKPEFWQDEDLAACSPHARLLAIAILQLCDANGVFRAIPMQIHAHAFPWEAEVNVQVLLAELERIGYLQRYKVQGKDYGHVPGFVRHQRLTGREAQSEGYYPPPDQADAQPEETGKHPGSTPLLPPEAQGKTGTGEQGNREQGDIQCGSDPESHPPKARPQQTAQRFAEFWETYPASRRRDKKRCLEIWRRKQLDEKADTIIADVRDRQAKDGHWVRGFIPLPKTYLNGDKWEDAYEDPQQQQPGNGHDVAAPWHALVTHCKRGHGSAEVAAEDPALAKAAEWMGGMGKLRGMNEHELQRQRGQFQSLYQQARQVTGANAPA